MLDLSKISGLNSGVKSNSIKPMNVNTQTQSSMSGINGDAVKQHMPTSDVGDEQTQQARTRGSNLNESITSQGSNAGNSVNTSIPGVSTQSKGSEKKKLSSSSPVFQTKPAENKTETTTENKTEPKREVKQRSNLPEGMEDFDRGTLEKNDISKADISKESPAKNRLSSDLKEVNSKTLNIKGDAIKDVPFDDAMKAMNSPAAKAIQTILDIVTLKPPREAVLDLAINMVINYITSPEVMGALMESLTSKQGDDTQNTQKANDSMNNTTDQSKGGQELAQQKANENQHNESSLTKQTDKGKPTHGEKTFKPFTSNLNGVDKKQTQETKKLESLNNFNKNPPKLQSEGPTFNSNSKVNSTDIEALINSRQKI